MEPKTNRANAKDWLEADKEIKIAAYVQSYMPTLNISERPFSNENLYEALKMVTVPLLDQDFQLLQELRAWDFLSDEALMIFERELT